MLYGWIDESGEMLTDEDAWKSGMYYCGDNGDGRMATGWKYITAVNDEDDDREGDGYWFYFATNGKKTADNDSKKINGRKYRFDENGAAHFEWYNDPGHCFRILCRKQILQHRGTVLDVHGLVQGHSQ